ncbi:MAG: glycosyltransferase family 4 protein [Selenomonadaceae bacterium]|nr:glycosyltransferase family 4 protein [Selenomonadaceae bacterium]
MNICLLVKDFAVGKKFSKDGLPTKSGAEFHAENHALQLIKLGNRVTIMAKKRFYFTKSRENLNGIDLVRLHAPFRWLEIIIRLLTTHRDVDVFYIIGTPKFAVWAVLFAKLFNKPITLALTGKAEIFDKNKNWRNKIFSTCNAYIATTHEIQRGFIELGGIDANKITVLAHGIDTNKYPKSNTKLKRELKVKHNLDADTKVLLFCARVVINKGIDTVMKFWKTIHDKRPAAKLFVVGGGRTEIIAELKELSKQLDDSIMVVGEVDKPQEYYQMADVYVFPSRHEGLPTSLIEAMSSGLPAVVSDIGGCDDLIFDDDTGYRVYSEDANGFAEKILMLFNDDKLRQSLGDNAAEYVRAHCDYSEVIPRLNDILHQNHINV